MKFVVFHQGALGDFFLTLTVLEGLCRSHPGSVVDFWSKPEHVALLSGKDYIGDSHPLDGALVPALLDDTLWENFPLPDFLSGADRIFIFGQEGSRVLAQRLSARLGGRADWIRSFPGPEHTGLHAGDFISEQLTELGWPHQVVFRTLYPPATEISAARRLLEGWGIAGNPVLVHPGSGGRRKVWPLRNWAALLRWIQVELRAPALISVGPADEQIGVLCRETGRAGVPVVRGLSAIVLSALLSQCRLYIGSDSGVSHLAAAVGTPAVVVFGPSDPEVWAPRGDAVRIVGRSWSEQDVLEWDRAEPYCPPDPGVIEEIMNLLGDGR